MKKNKIVIEKTWNRFKQKDEIHFFLFSENGKQYLFTQPFSKQVYYYFRSGRSEGELKDYKRWRINPRLNKIIEERIPKSVRYVQKENEYDYDYDYDIPVRLKYSGKWVEWQGPFAS